MRKLPLIPQPIWQRFLLPPPSLPSPLQTLLPPGCSSNLYVNEREKGVDGKSSIFSLAYLVWLFYLASLMLVCFLFMAREMQRHSTKLSPSLLAACTGTSASCWLGIVARECQGQIWVILPLFLAKFEPSLPQTGAGQRLGVLGWELFLAAQVLRSHQVWLGLIPRSASRKYRIVCFWSCSAEPGVWS